MTAGPSNKDEIQRFVSPTDRRTVESFIRAADTGTVTDKRLVEGARQLLQARIRTAKLFPKGILRDAAWDMLLELFISGEEGGFLYVKQLMIASGESVAGSMRRIERLEEADFITRNSDPLDQRRVIVRLTERGRTAMISMLRHIFEPHVSSGTPVHFVPRR